MADLSSSINCCRIKNAYPKIKKAGDLLPAVYIFI